MYVPAALGAFLSVRSLDIRTRMTAPFFQLPPSLLLPFSPAGRQGECGCMIGMCADTAQYRPPLQLAFIASFLSFSFDRKPEIGGVCALPTSSPLFTSPIARGRKLHRVLAGAAAV